MPLQRGNQGALGAPNSMGNDDVQCWCVRCMVPHRYLPGTRIGREPCDLPPINWPSGDDIALQYAAIPCQRWVWDGFLCSIVRPLIVDIQRTVFSLNVYLSMMGNDLF